MRAGPPLAAAMAVCLATAACSGRDGGVAVVTTARGAPVTVAPDAPAPSPGAVSTTASSTTASSTTASSTTASSTITVSSPTTTPGPAITAAPTTPAPPPVLSDPAAFGQPWPGARAVGLLTFRGNPTRSFHGTGPVPPDPAILWRYPDRPMCSLSSEYGETRQWCGIGWPGQPAVVERDGRTWVVVGAYDGAVHFVDGDTGAPILPPFQTGDLAKGGVTVDPDGFPIVYQGSRDNRFRAIAIDGETPRELWSMDAHALGERRWNDDWDGAALVLDDHLVLGGENSRFLVARLHRAVGPDGAVTVDPEIVANLPGWDQQLLADLGDNRVSLESSVMVLDDVAYAASSGGLVQGWDLSPLRTGSGDIGRVFRFWTGDDTDATIVGDDEGFLYVGVEVDRGTRRAGEVGQLLKLDPRRPDDPVVWSVDVDQGPDSGTWSTPAVTGDLVIWPTRPGTLYGLDRTTGAVRWTVPLAWGTITSPAVVDGILVQADGSGKVRAYELGDGRSQPALLWTVQLPANVEGTPAVWDGRIYVGCRDGFLYAIGGTR